MFCSLFAGISCSNKKVKCPASGHNTMTPAWTDHPECNRTRPLDWDVHVFCFYARRTIIEMFFFLSWFFLLSLRGARATGVDDRHTLRACTQTRHTLYFECPEFIEIASKSINCRGFEKVRMQGGGWLWGKKNSKPKKEKEKKTSWSTQVVSTPANHVSTCSLIQK